MRRRHRKTVLDINGEIDASRRQWPIDRVSSNPLTNLVGNYDSDSDDDGKAPPKKLNDKVNDFFKEIQSIAPGQSEKQITSTSYWQECFDESTGYPYYWHTKSNEVTWEMPPELKANKESGSKWPNATSKQYCTLPSPIPDGMIPKEVLMRNRNMQNKPVNKFSNKSVAKNYPPARLGLRDDSSDEGKIEMITSFVGNEDSESESEDDRKNNQMLKYEKKEKTFQDCKNDNKPFGPNLPPAMYLSDKRKLFQENSHKLSDALSQNIESASTANSLNHDQEDNILVKLKNQAKILQSQDDNEHKRSKDLKLSLVPGYEDDSDGDEDLSKKNSGKKLFPISNQSVSTNIRVYDYRKESDSVNRKSEENTSNETANMEELNKEEQDLKAAKFLENIDAPSKAFQRKRRIAFDVAPTKPKNQETAQEFIESSPSTNANSANEIDYSRQPEEQNLQPDIELEVTKEDLTITTKEEELPKERIFEKANFKNLTEIIMEKLKFLSEGSPAASAVQVMSIQLQTLLCAWESKALSDLYFHNWLHCTNCELARLEQTAAPPGWECQWDRTHKRYFYRNSSTNETQWTYPETGIAGGTEEMDLCTTPPPPEQEDSPIIEMNVENATIEAVKEAPKDKESATDIPTVPPPPPMISSPSPPPPPRIFAEDLQLNSKRKADSPEITSNKIKVNPPLLENSCLTKSKPLETLSQPELAYALTGHALETLYAANHQQANPIYAATIPLLSPHPALVPGQMMHYPAYHQHIHNQALVARLSGQDAVMHMVAAEYARAYDNNRVIAKPPVKSQESSLGSAINSFYSDIASIEKKTTEINEQKERAESISSEAVDSPGQQIHQPPSAEAFVDQISKEKKKKKLKTGLGKKQKEVSSMVAKWQRAQQNL